MEEEILEEEIQVQEENYTVNADLSDYYTKEETNDLLDGKADISDIPDISGKQDLITSTNKLESDLITDTLQTNLFVSNAEKTTWNGKQDALTFDSTPTLNSNNPVTSNGIALALENAGGSIEIVKMLKSADQTTRITKGQEIYDKIVDGKDVYLLLQKTNTNNCNAFCSITANTINNGSGLFVLTGTDTSTSTSISSYGIDYRPMNTYDFTVWITNNVVTNAIVTTYNGYALTETNAIVGRTNAKAYTPTGDYHPASKKYVDDTVANAVNQIMNIISPDN